MRSEGVVSHRSPNSPGEGVAEIVWAALREAREDVPGVDGRDGVETNVTSQLYNLQRALDAPPTSKERAAWHRCDP